GSAVQRKRIESIDSTSRNELSFTKSDKNSRKHRKREATCPPASLRRLFRFERDMCPPLSYLGLLEMC
ncbi:hypothetical protein P7K49_006357, partial [Saguinus oedipus]